MLVWFVMKNERVISVQGMNELITWFIIWMSGTNTLLCVC